MLLDRGGEGGAVRGVAERARVVPTRRAERLEAAQHVVEEERHPDALAAPLASDAVHAVVPVPGAHERKAVGSDAKRAVDRAAAVLVDARALTRGRRRQVRLVLAGLEQPRGDEARLLVEDRAVPGHGHVLARHPGKPEQVVGEARARPAVRHLADPDLVCHWQP